MSTTSTDLRFTSGQYREVLGRFTTGVAIITCPGGDGGATGVTVNSFSALSLDPPMVLWCLDNKTGRGESFNTCNVFAVNVLARAQQALSVRFSETGQHDFTGIKYDLGQNGAPVLPGALAVLECDIEARHEGGDHTIVVGRVTGLSSREGEPLLFYRGHYRGIGPHR